MASTSSKRSFDTFDEPNGTSSASGRDAPSKRSRPEPDPALWDMILKLPAAATQTLLYSICVQNPELSTTVREAHHARLAEEAARPPVNFDYYSSECWYTLNQKYKSMSCSVQFDKMGEICDVLSDSREAVLQKAGPETRYETRRNALEVLRKISKSIALCSESQIRHEIMKDGYVLSQFAESMAELAGGMSFEERDKYIAEGLYDSLVELRRLCGDEAGMEGLEDVCDIFAEALQQRLEHEDEREKEEDRRHQRPEHHTPEKSPVQEAPRHLPLAPLPSPIPQRTKVFSVTELS